MKLKNKTAIVIGASSGIGKELALLLSEKNYTVCATARRVELLDDLLPKLSPCSIVRKMDVAIPQEALNVFEEIIKEFQRIDLVIISAGVGHLNPELEWSKEETTIRTNVCGFTALAGFACNHFILHKQGHLVAISSLSGLRGGGIAPAYNASKAYVSNYLQGLRQKCTKIHKEIVITDICPGFVNTDMAKGEGLFWVQSPEKAAKQICRAIEKKRKFAYITKRWRLVAWILKSLPDFVYNRM